MMRARHATLTTSAVVLLVGAFGLAACSVVTTEAGGPSCTNGSKDDGEEGLDCGGTCPTKCTGSVCTANEECGSTICDNATCAPPAGKPCGVGALVPTCNDGEGCELDKDCASGFCDGATCATPPAGSHQDGQKNAGETGVDCGGSVKATQPCPDGQGCVGNDDCVNSCNAGTCGPIGPTDGVKNNGETDVDCGGPNAPKCADGKTCAADGDCAGNLCPDATKVCSAPSYDDGVKNGTETDVDCGGAGAGFKKCAEDKVCAVDNDCFGACKDYGAAKKCIDTPSCKPHFGGDTCGTNEVGTGAESHVILSNGTVAAGHESCCRSLEVKGYVDPVMPPGKTKVYLDKYEITAGRMRAFLEAVGGGVDAAGNAKAANVKAYTAAHRPNRWNAGWENVLPSANFGSMASYAIKNATTDLLYPGQDQYLANHYTQTTWWIGNAAGAQPAGTTVNHTIDVGIFHALGANHFFPEYWAQQPTWSQGPDYAASHALNCINTQGSYGYSTYWFDTATIVANTVAGPMDVVKGKYFSKNDLDQKALNCTPNALFAAFCAWDGGQLATAEVIDNVTGNTVSPIYDNGTCAGKPTGAGCQNGKLAIGKTTCGGNPHKYITYPDGGGVPCADVYYYPNDNGNDNYDGSSRIAPPGRVIGDVISKAPADEPWMDLVGNLQEAVLKKAETARFDYRGYGNEWSSITHHHNQQTTPRNKGGAFGARCMRFK